MTFWTNSRNLIGLDIGSHTVKALRLHAKASGYSVDALASTPIALTPDQPPSDEQLQCAVQTCLKQVEGQNKLAVCGLNGEEVVVRPFVFAPLPEHELAGAVRLEAGQVCPFSTDHATVDYHLLDIPSEASGEIEGPSSISGFLAAATNDTVFARKQLVTRAGGRCALLDVDGLALLNGIRALGTGTAFEDENQAIIHVGHSYTTVAISSSQAAPFVRCIPFAGNAITEHIHRDTDISLETIELALRTAEHDSITHKHIHISLKQVYTELAQRIYETLRFHATQQANCRLSSILVSGGYSLATDFLKEMAPLLPEYQLSIWNPFDHMATLRDESWRPLGPAFAVATSLALRTL
ncbi:MAG: pilus assembly protein PilM [Planctomycetes bacterium]|nr:pilus assembly protein PilM [Planctomycetota bacterium]